MRKTIFTILAGIALTTCLLSACRGQVTIKTDKGTDTIVFDSDSVQNININVEGHVRVTSGMECDPSELPATAEEEDRLSQLVLYVNEDVAPNEDENEGCYTVWLSDGGAGTLYKVLTTNPKAEPAWEKMSQKDADGVEVSLQQVGAASSARFASKDGRKIVVEGCPDARNTWTYIIDLDKRTAIQLPSTEGVQDIDMSKGEIFAASYGYYPAPDYGRYTVTKAYSLDGKFLRQASEPEPE